MIETDALVIGAGPVGLFQVFQLGLQGIAAHVVDALPQAGGQCIELYPDKPIYDIPGIARCTGQELTQQLLAQIAPFKPDFHFSQQVTEVSRQNDGRWFVTTPVQQFLTRTVFIAAGVGAFVPKELRLDGLTDYLGSQLFYRSAPDSATQNKRVVIVGGDDAAVAQALALTHAGSSHAASVTLIHRRDVLQASLHDLNRLAELRAAGLVQFQAGQVVGFDSAQGRLSQILISTPDDQTLKIALDTLLVCMGVSPKLGPISQWGLAMERKQLVVDTACFATDAPGVYAVGDINTYPGKKKLIICGFHEATLAAFAAASYMNPEASGVLQYTTSSALLQQRLGVQTDGVTAPPRAAAE